MFMMKHNISAWSIAILLAAPLTGFTQSNRLKTNPFADIDYSNPARLPAPPANAMGFPSRDADLDVLLGFQHPPPGYGEVPFWWWSGDPLNKERLLWQIDELHKKNIPGMQVNYMHKDTPGWPTYPAEPELFSDEWWDLWKFAANECLKRDMAIGLSGYTLDWPKSNNLFNRMIYSDPEIQGLELVADTVFRVQKGKPISLPVSDQVIGVWAYPFNDELLIPGGQNLASFIQNSTLRWTPSEGEWEVWVFAARRQPGTINPIHPLSGQMVIDKFFQPFEDHTVNRSADGLNYFFQDELQFGVGDCIWTVDFNEVFKQQKGYDVFEVLPALFRDMGPITPKARLDFMDVKVWLSEERYFIPIFKWHWSRGKIYGCDPDGRGKEPGKYGDNFRVIRWYTAPGHDTPGGGADLIKGKVSSSIATLYKRPRVWLEGYHSLGWGATPERLMFATNENYLYGCNLLNLHGLYYTTHGSYWEWAPPCYHFRMPYWDHMGVFLTYFERLSYLLSQGVLQADVAVMYPVSPVQAQMGGEIATETAFQLGTELFNDGHDFLFIDDQSLARSKVNAGHFHVSDQSFKALILPAMRAVRWSTLQKVLELYRSGGLVIAVGALPEASDRAGSSDPQLDAAVRELFGVSATENIEGRKVKKQTNAAGGIGVFVENVDQLKAEINLLLPRDVQSNQAIKYMHRKIGFRDLYMVMGASKNSWCTFRSKGKVERWDPWTGKNLHLYEVSETTEGTRVKMPLDADEAQIIVFSSDEQQVEIVATQLEEISSVEIQNGKPVIFGFDNVPGRKSATVKINGQLQTVSGIAPISLAPMVLDGEWEFELKPTMDNRWGDFRLPVTEQMVGAEARIFRYAEETSDPEDWEHPMMDDSQWSQVTYGFGQKFWKLGPLPADFDPADLDRKLSSEELIDPARPVIINRKIYQWTPYNFSWRWGIEGDPGHQGWHGLKEEITDDFICLGKPSPGLNETVYVEEEGGTRYYLWTTVFSEKSTNASVEAGGLTPSAMFLNGKRVIKPANGVKLKQGANPLLLRYDAPGRGHFVLIKKDSPNPERKTPLSMKWWDMTGRLSFDVRAAERNPAGWYRFTAPPGLQSMIIRANGHIKIWVNGEPQAVGTVAKNQPATYEVVLNEAVKRKSVVALRIEQLPGYYGGAALPEPILLKCTTGVTNTGDWSQGSVLACYSGGAWYRRSFTLSKQESNARVFLDLGEIMATAEVHINSAIAGILVSPPWKLDISEWVTEGNNKIEILVYNTLANHYVTIPTRYRGDSLKSGLIGPVKLAFSAKVVLK
jgi:hypothetical protein